jgi:hypothetical protein
MSGTHRAPALAAHRDAVEDRMVRGEPFGVVEDAIDAAAGLTADQRSALWLFAFSLRDPSERRLDAWTHLTAVQ